MARNCETAPSFRASHLNVTTSRGVVVVSADSTVVGFDRDTASVFDCCINVLFASAIVDRTSTADIEYGTSLTVTVVGSGANPSIPVAKANVCEVGVAGGIGFTITTGSRVEANVTSNARRAGKNACARERGEGEEEWFGEHRSEEDNSKWVVAALKKS